MPRVMPCLQRFLQPDEEHRQKAQNNQSTPTFERRNPSDDSGHERHRTQIKPNARHPCPAQSGLNVLTVGDAIGDIDDRPTQNEGDAPADGNRQSVIQIFERVEPERMDDMFKTEYAAVEKSEDR